MVTRLVKRRNSTDNSSPSPQDKQQQQRQPAASQQQQQQQPSPQQKLPARDSDALGTSAVSRPDAPRSPPSAHRHKPDSDTELPHSPPPAAKDQAAAAAAATPMEDASSVASSSADHDDGQVTVSTAGQQPQNLDADHGGEDEEDQVMEDAASEAPEQEDGGEEEEEENSSAKDLPEEKEPLRTVLQRLLQTDDFVSKLSEPLQSLVGKLLIGSFFANREDEHQSNNETAEAVTPDAAVRLDRFEIALREETLKRIRSCWSQLGSNSASSVNDLGSFWEQVLQTCLHLVTESARAAAAGEENYHPAPTRASNDNEVWRERYADLVSVRKQIPLILLEDMLDSLPMEVFLVIWEQHAIPSYPPLFGTALWRPTAGAKSQTTWLPFLKLANKFLRLLNSSSAHASTVSSSGTTPSSPQQAAAALMQTMARVYPLSEKSAIKVWGSHNSETVTELETAQEFEQQADATMSEQQDSHEHIADYSFYESFWKLQHDFSNPYALSVADFIQRLGTFFKALQSHKVAPPPATNASATTTATTTVHDDINTQSYLTSSRLLPLQLQDVDFRIHVLTQFLLAAHHLTSQVASLGPRLRDFCTTAKQLLCEIPVVGPAHLQLVESVLATLEPQWRRWKQNKCTPDIDRPRSRTSAKAAAGKMAGTKRKREVANGGLKMNGNDDNDDKSLYQLIVVQKDLPQLSCTMRQVVPSLQDHLSDYVEALDPESGIEAEYHPKNDKLHSWRAFRLMAAHHLEEFDKIGSNGDIEPAVRHIYKEQKGIDIPGEAPVYHPELDDEESSDEEEKDEKQKAGADEEERREGDEPDSSSKDKDAMEVDKSSDGIKVEESEASNKTNENGGRGPSPMDEDSHVNGNVGTGGTASNEAEHHSDSKDTSDGVKDSGPAAKVFKEEEDEKPSSSARGEPSGARSSGSAKYNNGSTDRNDNRGGDRSSQGRGAAKASPPRAHQPRRSPPPPHQHHHEGEGSRPRSPASGGAPDGPSNVNRGRGGGRDDDRRRSSSNRGGRRSEDHRGGPRGGGGGDGPPPRDERRGGGEPHHHRGGRGGDGPPPRGGDGGPRGGGDRRADFDDRRGPPPRGGGPDRQGDRDADMRRGGGGPRGGGGRQRGDRRGGDDRRGGGGGGGGDRRDDKRRDDRGGEDRRGGGGRRHHARR